MSYRGSGTWPVGTISVQVRESMSKTSRELSNVPSARVLPPKTYNSLPSAEAATPCPSRSCGLGARPPGDISSHMARVVEGSGVGPQGGAGSCPSGHCALMVGTMAESTTTQTSAFLHLWCAMVRVGAGEGMCMAPFVLIH
eukprot:113515-Rhodomonas_salina.2